MQNKDYPKLLNCPFCGGDARVVECSQWNEVFVKCSKCGIMTESKLSREQVVADLNCRTAPENKAHGLQTIYDTPDECPYCHEHLAREWSYCPECGRPTDGNRPLTLEQLRQMDGKPVWCDWINGWALIYIDGISELNFLYSDESSNSIGELIDCLGTYGKKWIAYVRRPENALKSYRCDADGEVRSDSVGFGEPGCDDEDGAGIYCKNCHYARLEEK